MSRGGGEPKKEDVVTAGLVIAGCLAAIVLLVWLAASKKIVLFWTPPLYAVSKIWTWLPDDLGSRQAQLARATATRFWEAPADVRFMDWVLFVNNCARPLAWVVTALMLGWLVLVCLRRPPALQRKFDPQDLAVRMSFVFTGTAPVLHLRKLIAADKEPYWRRQVFPHEVLLHQLVNGKPLVMDNEMVDERAREYFCGLEQVKVKTDKGIVLRPRTVGGRLVSRMLGNQVVDLLTDRGKHVVFADRFSPTGKVIFALLCAHAFGGRDGVKDYAKARDQLNNSARGAQHGFANLSVVQWLFDKYRANPTAHQLFAIHHWEHTYLFELSFQAKRQGKCGDWEFLWLKPMNRVMFYAMNTVGRLTPHTESAATFAQHAYEKRVARRKRLPLARRLDDEGRPTGGYMHVIYVEKAVRGLALEWERWRDGDEDEDQWWRGDAEWKRLNGVRLDPPPAPPPELAAETPFDQQMRGDAGRQNAAAEAEMAALIAAERAQLE